MCVGVLHVVSVCVGVQDVIEIMREGMFDCAPLSGLAGGVPVLDFRKAPGSRGGKAGEAARFIAALRAMASQQDRDTFSTAELQVRATETMVFMRCTPHSLHTVPTEATPPVGQFVEMFVACTDGRWCAVVCCVPTILPTYQQDVIQQLQLKSRDPRAFIDQLNEAGESKGSLRSTLTLSCYQSEHACCPHSRREAEEIWLG